MTAALLYRRAIESGVTLRLVEGKMKASGSHEALAAFVPQLREHKAQLIDYLTRQSINASTVLGLESQSLAIARCTDKATTPAKLNFLDWAEGWRELNQAYQRHHFNCPICIAAGKGYGLRCGAGTALWTAYTEAS